MESFRERIMRKGTTLTTERRERMMSPTMKVKMMNRNMTNLQMMM